MMKKLLWRAAAVFMLLLCLILVLGQSIPESMIDWIVSIFVNSLLISSTIGLIVYAFNLRFGSQKMWLWLRNIIGWMIIIFTPISLQPLTQAGKSGMGLFAAGAIFLAIAWIYTTALNRLTWRIESLGDPIV